MKIKMIIVFFLLMASLVHSQTKHTVSGHVKDKNTGEQLIGALVSFPELKGTGMATNEYGFYSLTLPAGQYQLQVNMIGYKTYTKTIQLTTDVRVDVSVEDATAEMEEVVISAGKQENIVQQAQMGVEKLDVKEINKIPVLMGEKDVMKTIQLLPGIKSAEGSAGFYVRGGAGDQNLILLDEAPVYNASHLLGFFSTFNSDAIKDLSIYKGSMPAQYGGRLSSVLDIKMNDGNDQKMHVGGGIGIISSKLSVEGPIVKDRGSFLLTGRRTYADMFLKLSKDENLKDNKLFFYDLNLKANYRLNDKNRVFVSAYNGQDQLGLGKIFNMSWGNSTATVRWNHIYNPRLFSNTSAIYSNYNYRIKLALGDNEIAITSKIKDWNLKHEFQYFPNPKNKIRFGFNAMHHTIVPGQLTSKDTAALSPAKLQDKYALDNALFFSNEWSPAKKINVVYGLRGSAFSLVGDGDFYKVNKEGDITDTVHSTKNEIVQTYFNLEPRLSLSYVFNDRTSVKASYSRNAQNLHLISNSTSGSPTDLWIPSSLNTKPEVSDQYSLGYYQTLKRGKYELSSEIYYKNMANQIDYRDGAETGPNGKIETQLLYGGGRAYGIEVLVKKKTGKLTGWIGYTLSRSERKIDGINNNEWYLAKQDRTHDISVVGIYDLSKKWSFSAAWVYYTGNAVTFPSGKYMVNNEVNFEYTERNGYRMPAYHRLDIGVTWYQKKTTKFESSWNFSVYNAYGRENAFMIKFRQDPDDASRTQAVQTTLFKIVPSVTYNFKF
ncbi:MAG: TonB-dependent receptor [Bacteroidia bacterium]|nr:TonB-dependent receptor [Bacteroidia bacterium]